MHIFFSFSFFFFFFFLGGGGAGEEVSKRYLNVFLPGFNSDVYETNKHSKNRTSIGDEMYFPKNYYKIWKSS